MPTLRRLVPFALLASVWLAFDAAALAEEPYVAAARQLSAATVTVRTTRPAANAPQANLAGQGVDESEGNSDGNSDGDSDGESDAKMPPARPSPHPKQRVTIASGVVVGENLIVTAVCADRDCRFTLLTPAGRQTEARLRVVDANTSLALLEVVAGDAPAKAPAGEQPANAATAKSADNAKQAAADTLPRLSLGDEPPRVGARVLAASAWGAEPPSVSLGIVGGVDRFVPGAGLPPLVQCDVHTTPTSLGAGIVDVDGALVGIVVACDGEGRNARWAYAVPAEHVRRLLAARRDDQIVEIPRQRPHAGIGLRQSGASQDVVVRYVVPDGPAAKAGLRVGDVVESLDGRAASSVFEAAKHVATRKPGDAVEFRVRREGQSLACVVTLAEGDEDPTFSFAGKKGPAAPAKSSVGDEQDLVAEFRRQLRQRDDRIARLEAELAELRRGSQGGAASPPDAAASPPPRDR